MWGYAYTKEHDSFGERSLFVLDKPRERATTPATPPAAQQQPGKPAAKAITKPEPLTFEQRWELLELHAAEMACTTWPVMKTVASLAVKSSELEIPRLGQRQLEQLLEQAQRRIRAKTEPVLGGATFTITATPWAVDGIFRHGLNLLVGQSGAGKSRLAAACMASWLRGDETWLQRPLHGIAAHHRHALIIGTDQPLTDWHLTLGPVGLTAKISETEVRVHERLTLYGLESGLQLDADGLNTIRRWVDAHPGGMVLIDSLSACLPLAPMKTRAAQHVPYISYRKFSAMPGRSSRTTPVKVLARKETSVWVLAAAPAPLMRPLRAWSA